MLTNKSNYWNLAIMVCALLLSRVASTADTPDSLFGNNFKPVINNVAGDVYRFSYGTHHSAFVVTDEGIIMTDPISSNATKWIRKEIKKRWNKPVKYVIYSHDHFDHVYGGESYKDDGATFISHKYAKDSLLLTNAQTVIPDITFSDKMDITLDDKTVTLMYLGANEGQGSTVMLIQPDRVLYGADWLVMKRLSYMDMPGGNIWGQIRSLQAVEHLDFDYVAPGHHKIGIKQDVINLRRYQQALLKEVSSRMSKGQSLEQIQKEISLPEFKGLDYYDDWLHLNAAGVYRQLNTGAPYMKERLEFMGH